MRNWEVELHLGAPNGSAPRAAKPFNRMGFEVEADGGGSAGSGGTRAYRNGAPIELVHVERSAEDGDREMSEERRVVIELNPADDAVVFQILRDFRFADLEVLGELGF